MSKNNSYQLFASRQDREKKESSFCSYLKIFFLSYFEWILVFFVVGIIFSVCLFSWLVAESSWNLAEFQQKNLVLPRKGITIYVEGAVQKKGIYLLKKEGRTEEVLEKARLEKGAYPWRKIYKKTLKESASLYIPYKEEGALSWESSALVK